MQKARRYLRWLGQLVEPETGRRILEVGCGLGNFTGLLLKRDLVVAVDSRAECVERLRQTFPDRPNLVSLVEDVGSPSFQSLHRYNPDTVLCLNVLEHVRDDLQALANMHAVLPAGGKLILIVPAFQSLFGPIDARLGHYRRYSKESLGQRAEISGFEPLRMRYFNSIGFLGWWYNAHILKLDRQSESQIGIFDSLVVPILSRLERIVEPPFGQSILAVLSKKN